LEDRGRLLRIGEPLVRIAETLVKIGKTLLKIGKIGKIGRGY
jgi:hypothetical protein